jgi:thioredoxin family protein
MPRSIVAASILCGALLFAATIPVLSFVRQDVDYQAVYAQGTTFADFLEKARAHREEWRANYNDATVSAALVTRMRALPAKRHLLVVAEDWCSDSLNTVPYVARLVDGGAERLDMRVVNREIGKAVMEAHRTPDGRTATPTIAILDEDWHLLATWTERPSSVQAWFLEKQKTTMQKPLHDELLAWYQNDAGKTTVLEIAGLLER